MSLSSALDTVRRINLQIVLPIIFYIISLRRPITQFVLTAYEFLKLIFIDLKDITVSVSVHFLLKALTYYHKHNFLPFRIESSLNTLPTYNNTYGVYDLTYRLDDITYHIRFKRVRGPSKFQLVTSVDSKTGTSEDVTDIIQNMAGPSHNFYGIPTTPNMLNYDTLIVTYVDDSIRTFTGEDLIIA